MSYLVLARKWRPGSFDDLVGQEPIIRILKNAISQTRIAHAYLFSGPRGVGKTSAARILARALNCREGMSPNPCGRCDSCISISDGSSVDVIEIDGASNNSVDDIRDLRERVKYAPSGSSYKVYIIDEVHMLSTSAFNALLKTLEEPPSHVVFVLATTEMRKIPATVISRCQHMPFRRISSNIIRGRLKHISDAEGISISQAALGLVARAADGSMRDALTILDQLFSFSSDLTEETVQNLLGLADFGVLAKAALALIKGERAELIHIVGLLAEQGSDMRSFSRELIQFFRDLLVASVVDRPDEVLDLSLEEISGVRDIVVATTDDQLVLMLSELMKAEQDVRASSSPRIALEMALIRASFLSSMTSLKDAIENIKRYKPGAAASDLIPQPPSVSHTYSEDSPASRPVTPMQEGGPGDKLTDGSVHEGTDDAALSHTANNADDVSVVWEKVVARLEPPLASKLTQSTVELKGEELFLTLDGGQAVFEDSIRREAGTIEKIFHEESGMKVTVCLASRQKKTLRKKDMKEKAIQDPLIREALELFDGRIVDVSAVDVNGQIKNGGNHV